MYKHLHLILPVLSIRLIHLRLIERTADDIITYIYVIYSFFIRSAAHRLATNDSTYFVFYCKLSAVSTAIELNEDFNKNDTLTN